jgi:hypothetical protein
MSPLAADVIGLVGSALFITAFAYANLAKQLNKVWFNLANLAGAILLLISLSVTFNLAAFVLEAAWGAIAAVGLVLAVCKSSSPSTLPRAGGEPGAAGAEPGSLSPPPSRGRGKRAAP